MRIKVRFLDLGLKKYQEVLDIQEKIHADIVKRKIENIDKPRVSDYQYGNTLIFCEHNNVFTIGKNGSEHNLLIDKGLLKEKNIECFRTNRGGDITYHGPGQIVGYPVLDLKLFNIGVRGYIFLLEEAVIKTLASFDINAERMPGATGVWIDTNGKTSTRKICAIGVRVSRQVTMHGLAFNVNTDLSYYNHIHPCGFTDKGVTSMQSELQAPIDIVLVKENLKRNLQSVFCLEFIC